MKQTAANNEFLKTVKREWNTKIFNKASAILNSDGIEKAREFVQQFSTRKIEYPPETEMSAEEIAQLVDDGSEKNCKAYEWN